MRSSSCRCATSCCSPASCCRSRSAGRRSIAAAQQAVREQRQVGILLQRDRRSPIRRRVDMHRMGTVANIVRYITAPDGTHHLVCQGDQRFQVRRVPRGWPFLVARVLRIPEPEASTPEIEARLLHLRGQALEALELLPQAPPELIAAVQSRRPPARSPIWPRPTWTSSRRRSRKSWRPSTSPRAWTRSRGCWRTASRCCGCRRRSAGRRRPRSTSASARCCCASRWPRSSGSSAKARKARPPRSPSSTRRSPRPKCRKRSRTHARKELRRLQRMPEAAAEYGMVRTYLDWLIELPWKLPEEAPIDIAEARAHPRRRSLRPRQDQAAHHRISRRAQARAARQGADPVLRRPARRRQDLARPVDRARHEPQIRARLLGGVHDEAEIRGHRRTYIGALPGNIIQAIRKAGTRNCVMMLDEIDKLGAGIHGDPSAALLEVLDPEQNNTFRDNYLGVPFDLSRVVFITTANMLDTIPGPLRDRMEIISLAGYTDDEKLQIATRYLVRRQMEANGLKRRPGRDHRGGAAARSSSTTRAKRACAISSARSARCCATPRCASRRAQRARSRSIATRSPPSSGAPQFENEVAMRTSVPGVATGLAWTPVGGDILFIEATRMPGSGRLILTGQLGDVMKESAQAALSHRQEPGEPVRHRARALREERHPRPRAGGRHPEGRAERGRRHVHGARLADDRAHRAQRYRHDRRDQPARPGAAGRRHQGEGGGGGARRA